MNSDMPHDDLLGSNLERVFNERDPARRMSAIDELYSAEPVMYEPDNVVVGRKAIADVAGALLEQFGQAFRFRPDGPTVSHHGVAVLRWRGGPGDETVVTGFDVAEIADGRIARLWVLIEPPATR